MNKFFKNFFLAFTIINGWMWNEYSAQEVICNTNLCTEIQYLNVPGPVISTPDTCGADPANRGLYTTGIGTHPKNVPMSEWLGFHAPDRFTGEAFYINFGNRPAGTYTVGFYYSTAANPPSNTTPVNGRFRIYYGQGQVGTPIANVVTPTPSAWDYVEYTFQHTGGDLKLSWWGANTTIVPKRGEVSYHHITSVNLAEGTTTIGECPSAPSPPIEAVDDFQTIYKGAVGTVSVLDNDAVNGATATTSNVNLTQISTTNNGVMLNTSTGRVAVAAGTATGTYTLVYRICDKANANVCGDATVTVFVPTDSDGDSIADLDDLDDDNDGILDTAESDVLQFVNGNFSNTFIGWANNGFTYNSTNGSVSSNSDCSTASISQTISCSQPIIKSFSFDFGWYNGVASCSSTTVSQLSVKLGGVEYLRILTPSGGNTNTDDATGQGGDALVTSYNGATFEINGASSQGEEYIDHGALKTITLVLPIEAQNSNFTFDAVMGADNLTIDNINVINGFCPKDTNNNGILNYLDLDSDGDGCPDALEGGDNVAISMLDSNNRIKVAANGTTTPVVVDADGVPVVVNAGSTFNVDGQAQGQTAGTAYNNGLGYNACKCFKAGATGGTVLSTSHGITILSRAGNNGDGNAANDWPMVRKGAWTALEGKSKGFVINRVPTTAQVNAITNAVEGMMVYDEQSDCLKIYTKDNAPATTYSWKCFNNQTCPDVL